MEFKQLVRQARTCRRFVESDPIPRQVLVDLVDTARLVPSGGNQQPLRYRIVWGGECECVFPHTRWAAALKDWGGPRQGERPTGYILMLALHGRNAATDVGICGQTLQLAATAAGYGACMLGNIDRAAIHTALALPKELEIQLLVAFGRPAETVVLEEASPGGSVAYWRTPDQVHHVPKRPLSEVLITP